MIIRTAKIFRMTAMIAAIAIIPVCELSIASEGSAGQQSAGERSLLSQGFGARALALGGAYVSLASGSDATFWNPSWLTRVDRQAFSVTHARFFQDTEINSASWGHNYDNLGAVGLSFTRLGLDDIPSVNNWVVGSGNIEYSTSLATLSYARSFGSQISVGVTGKALYESLFGSQDYGFGLDVGLGWRMDHYRAGIIIRDALSTDVKIGATAESQPIASQFGLGLDSISLTKDFIATVGAEIELMEGPTAFAHLGAEMLMYDKLALRGGVDERAATFGVGFVFDALRIDYGIRLNADIGETHLFGFNLLFGSSAKERASAKVMRDDALGEEYVSSDRAASAQKAYAKASDFRSAGELDSALAYYRLAQTMGATGADGADLSAQILVIESKLQEQATLDSIAIVEASGIDSSSLAALAAQLAIGLAEELQSEKRFGSAIRVLEKALSEDSNRPDLTNAIAQIVSDRDSWKVEQLAKANKAQSSGDYILAFDVYASLIREFPDDSKIRGPLSAMSSKLKISDLLSQAGRKLDSELYEEAKVYVERALFIDSTNAAALGLMERILRSIPSDASIRAISEDPLDWAQMSQALTDVREGRLQEALDIFNSLLEKYPHNSELKRNKEQVELRLLGSTGKR